MLAAQKNWHGQHIRKQLLAGGHFAVFVVLQFSLGRQGSIHVGLIRSQPAADQGQRRVVREWCLGVCSHCRCMCNLILSVRQLREQCSVFQQLLQHVLGPLFRRGSTAGTRFPFHRGSGRDQSALVKLGSGQGGCHRVVRALCLPAETSQRANDPQIGLSRVTAHLK